MDPKRRLTAVVAGTVALIGALAVSPVGVGELANAAPPAEASAYTPITPTRVVDTRNGLGAPLAPLAANTTLRVQITGSAVPANATAVVINVTATRSQGNGWLQVFPPDRAAVGSSSTLNLDFSGQTIPNASFAPLSASGELAIHATFTTDVLLDVFGYFVPSQSSTAGRLVPLTPTRILDTRVGLGWTPGDTKSCADFATQAAAQDWFDTYVATFGDVAQLDQDDDGVACEEHFGTGSGGSAGGGGGGGTGGGGVPPNPGNTKNCGDFATYAEAKAWFETYFPHYGDVAQLDSDGDGIPCETLPGAPKAFTGAVGQAHVQVGAIITLQVAGRGGVPPFGASAVVMNVTAAAPEGDGYVQVAPTPVTVGASSNLNTAPGRTIANLVVVPISAGGTVDLYTNVETELLADVVGYFTNGAAAASSSGLFVPVAPDRQLDTRQPAPQPVPAAGTTTRVDVSDVAPAAIAIAGNLTATAATAEGWVQVAAPPVSVGASSNLNTAYNGQTIANAVVSPVGAGQLDAHTFRSAHLLLDMTGWFTGDT
ncbi:MAG: excalibur calcium-binding domain-containing protein [Microbacteriaceae bacterium]